MYPLNIIFLLLLLLFAGCSPPTADEAALRRNLEEMQAAIESKDMSRVLDFADPEFVGPNGMDYSDLKNFTRLMLLRQRNVGVTSSGLQIQIHENRAVVNLNVIVTGGDRFFPDNARSLKVTTTWQRDGADWKLIVADWQ